MEEKLRSILRQIHWSSVLKAGVAAIAWYLFPFWLFLIVVLYLYFVPVSQGYRTTGAFWALVVLAALEPRGVSFMLIFGGIFLYMLLIRDLLLIDRKSAYEILALLLSFLLLRTFYIHEGGGIAGSSLIWSFVTAALLAWLYANYIDTFEAREGAIVSPLSRPVRWLLFLLSWQFIVAGLFLPLDFVYQSVIVFLALVFFIDLIPQYLFGELTKDKVLITSTMVFSLAVLILGSARWGL